MAIIGCYWDSKNLELFIECFDDVNNMYLSVSDRTGKLSNKNLPTQADEAAVLAALDRAYSNCSSLNSPVTAIHYKGPHRTTVQGQKPFGKSTNIKSLTLLAEAVLVTVDNFSNTKLACDAFRKRVGIPNGKVLKAANALVTAYGSSAFTRSNRLALFGAMDIGNGIKGFKTITNKVIKSHLNRHSGFSVQQFKIEQDKIFSKIS